MRLPAGAPLADLADFAALDMGECGFTIATTGKHVTAGAVQNSTGRVLARRRELAITLAALGFLACGGQASAPLANHQAVSVSVTDSPAPPGVDVAGAQWIKIKGAGGLAGSEQLAAVFRPPGQGPFPLVIALHGSAGLTDADVRFAATLAQAGFVAVAGCYDPTITPPNSGQFYELTLTIVACPNLLASHEDAISALIVAGRKQPGVRANVVGLFGISAGGPAALEFVAARGDVRAVALDSPAVQSGPDASKIQAPVLVLSGTADTYVPFSAQKDYVDSLQAAGKQVEWHYYEGGRHALILDPANKDDAIHRIIDFLTRRLTDTG